MRCPPSDGVEVAYPLLPSTIISFSAVTNERVQATQNHDLPSRLEASILTVGAWRFAWEGILRFIGTAAAEIEDVS